MFISAKSALAGAVQRILADADSYTYPVQIEVRSGRRLSTGQQATIHAMLRDIARHAQNAGIPCTENALKEQVKRGEVAGIEWPGSHEVGWNGDEVWKPKATMDLSSAECRDLIDQLGAFGAEHGVEWSKVESWSE